jgi:hypothetical protein
MANINKLAAKYASKFVVKTRDNGDKFYSTEGDRPQALTDLIFDAHNDMLPDDYKYAFIVDALEYISDDTNNVDDPELREEPYNHALLKWLSSNLQRAGYVDDYVNETGYSTSNFDLFNLISCGMMEEQLDVYYSVLTSLRKLCNEL